MPTAAAEKNSHVDYLAVAAPHGRVFPRLTKRSELAEFELTPAQVASFRENGFVHDVRILSDAQIERIRQGLEDIVQRKNPRATELLGAPTDPASPMTYFQNGWIIDEAIHDLVFHPAITVKVGQLLNTPRVRFWHDQVFYKPARTGGNVAWHQDYSYWQRATPSQHMTVWIGLDDSRVENGCLHAVPGSHKWPLLDPTALMGDMEGLAKQLTPEQRAQFKPQALEQPCGACSFHHDHTVHGSFANKSDRPRRAIVLNYMADGTLSAAKDGVLMPGFPPVPEGKKIEGPSFPLVYDRDALQ
jgi:hypothetical protein